MKILIVEDSPDIQEYLIELTETIPGVQMVGAVQSVADALLFNREKNPDVIILDLQLSDGNGLSVLDEVKKSMDAPIIIINTFYPYPQYKTRALKSGAEYFFDKAKDLNKIEETLLEIRNQTRHAGKSL